MRLRNFPGHLPALQAGKRENKKTRDEDEECQGGEAGRTRQRKPGWWCMPVILVLRRVARAEPVWAGLTNLLLRQGLL